MAHVSLTIPTRGRPDLLHRALRSYLANAEAHGHEVTVTVIDDGTGCDLPRDVHGTHAYRVLDRECRRRISQTIAHALDLPEDVVTFALLGDGSGLPTTGAARNTALLATVGRIAASVDDDTECALQRPCDSAPRHRRSGLLIDPQGIWFGADRLRGSGFEPVDEDFFGRLCEHLGATPASLEVASLGPHVTAAALRHPVLATVAGSDGDSGMECAPHLLLETESFERIAADSLAYTRARSARTLLRIPRSLEVSATPVLMTMACAFDNRVGLPPFCPVGRNQDGMYGALLQWVFAPAPVAFIPLAVRHGGARPVRPWRDRVWQTVVPNRLSDVFEVGLHWFAPHPLGGSLLDRFAHVGRRLELIGRLSGSAFHDLAAESIRARAKARSDLIDTRLGQGQRLPPRLRHDLTLASGRLHSAVANPAEHLPASDVLNTWQRVIGRYGAVVAIWPAIRMFVQHDAAWTDQGLAPSPRRERPIVPSRRPPLMECPLCGGRFAEMLPFGDTSAVLRDRQVLGAGYRANARCPQCQSLDRERLVFLYLLRCTRVLTQRSRILHIAPEPALRRLLALLPMTHHIAVDVGEGRGVYRMDLQRLPLADASVDVVICNHVLEYVPDDFRALSELRRVLRPLGFAIIQVPIVRALARTVEEGVGRVRMYGRDYVSRLRAAGFTCRAFAAPTHLGVDVVQRFALMPDEVLHVFYRAPIYAAAGAHRPRGQAGPGHERRPASGSRPRTRIAD